MTHSRISVPSKRVETLPQQPGTRCESSGRRFQYPQSGSRRCRATKYHVTALSAGIFQYPQSGSRRCRGSCPGPPLYRCIISVPSKRVETLPRLACRSTIRLCPNFSTLKAGRDAAAASGTVAKDASGNISVPSKRVETLPHRHPQIATVSPS